MGATLFYSKEAAPKNCLILQHYIQQSLAKELKAFLSMQSSLLGENVFMSKAIPFLRIFVPSTLENRHIFTMKVKVYSGIREYLNRPIKHFLLYWGTLLLTCYRNSYCSSIENCSFSNS